jgi:hypothetical protein
MAPWKLPLIVAALVIPIVAGFMVAGPALGVALGALAVTALLVIAVRDRPRGPIGAERAAGESRRVLIAITRAVEDPGEVARIADAAGLSGVGDEDEVRLLVPARIGFLDRWASDVESARHEAQQHLVATVAALAKAGIAAEARVGDEDVVQAIEDQLQSFPASEVVLASGAEDAADAAAAELRARLRSEFREVRLGEGDAQQA